MALSRGKALELYNNPPIAETIPGRCEAALTYFDEKRNGWSVNIILQKAGISETTFYKAKKARKDPNQAAPRGKGQEPILSQSAFARLEQVVTERSLRLDAPEATIKFAEII
jgi:hypothetical protein